MWKEGSVKVHDSVFHYWIKVYDVPSLYGIDDGKVSKLKLTREGMTACNYDRGWDIEPTDEDTQLAVEILLQSNN